MTKWIPKFVAQTTMDLFIDAYLNCSKCIYAKHVRPLQPPPPTRVPCIITKWTIHRPHYSMDKHKQHSCLVSFYSVRNYMSTQWQCNACEYMGFSLNKCKNHIKYPWKRLLCGKRSKIKSPRFIEERTVQFVIHIVDEITRNHSNAIFAISCTQPTILLLCSFSLFLSIVCLVFVWAWSNPVNPWIS